MERASKARISSPMMPLTQEEMTTTAPGFRSRAASTCCRSLSRPPKTASAWPMSLHSKWGLMALGRRMPRLKRFFLPGEEIFCQV